VITHPIVRNRWLSFQAVRMAHFSTVTDTRCAFLQQELS
jgi:hypothetical protein